VRSFISNSFLIDNVMFVPLIGFVKNTINGTFNANNEYKITKEKA